MLKLRDSQYAALKKMPSTWSDAHNAKSKAQHTQSEVEGKILADVISRLAQPRTQPMPTEASARCSDEVSAL